MFACMFSRFTWKGSQMLKRLAFALALMLGSTLPVFAQTATISGRVIDQGDAVLPGVNVTVKNLATGITREGVTNGEGIYAVPALTPGRYSVAAALTGFAPMERTNIELLTGANLAVELKMRLASVQESVTVTAQSPLVETTQSVLSNSVRQAEVEQLPMLNRSIAAIMTMLPGAREVPVTAASAHGQSSNWVSFGGGGGQNYNMVVDGTDNKENHCGGTGVAYSLEGIQEFRVLTTGGSAEYGRGSTTVLVASKSGTNRFGGSIFGYGRNEKMIATDYFSKPENGGAGKLPFTRAQYGGSIGGPIKTNKAFFFGAAERVTQQFSVPRSDAAFKELALLTPLNISVKNTTSINQPSRDLMAQGKVSVNVSQAHSLYIRYAGQFGYVDNDAVTSTAALLSYSPYSDRNAQTLHSIGGGWTWIVSPTTVNQFSVQGYSFTHDNQYPECPRAGGCLVERLTFPSVSVGPVTGGAFPHWYNFERRVEFREDFSKQMGKHSFKAGGSYMNLPRFGGVFGGGSPGAIAFFDDPSTIVNNTNGRYPLGFQTPGIVRSISVTSTPIGDYSSKRNFALGAYLQDDFHVSRKLTLNLGLRYDVYDFMNTKYFESNRAYQILKAIGSPYGALPKIDRNNIGPRVGVAFDVHGDGKDTIRGTYGRFYMAGIKNTYFTRAYIEQPTVFVTTVTANSAIGVGALSNFVYGVTPLPAQAVAPTQLPAGSSGAWYDPKLQDFQTDQFHAGYSHAFEKEMVIAFDYTHFLGRNGWRNLNINPLLIDPNNPSGARVRPLAADFLRVYGVANTMSTVNIIASVNRGLYDEFVAHFERRFTARSSVQANYTLAWARGMGGVTDGSTRQGSAAPQVASATGGDIYAPWESGPALFDERHRATVAGVFNLPFGFSASPSFTVASARPYQQIRGANPSGDGNLQLLDASGNPVGINNARGVPLVNANARVTRTFAMRDERRVAVFLELYNLINRANFGNQFFGNSVATATYNKPAGFLGGSGSVSTIPNSFQVQIGARFSF